MSQRNPGSQLSSVDVAIHKLDEQVLGHLPFYYSYQGVGCFIPIWKIENVAVDQQKVIHGYEGSAFVALDEAVVPGEPKT
ncbi:MAG TPA: hypothetical protein VNT42_00510 [Sphingomonas sp.]|nr:hypothetical protein [Sphingomonas sp.]